MGGYNIPEILTFESLYLIGNEGWLQSILNIQAIILGLKTCLFCFMFVWFRATLPRLRYDQLIEFCWLYLLPLIIALIILVPAIIINWEIFIYFLPSDSSLSQIQSLSNYYYNSTSVSGLTLDINLGSGSSENTLLASTGLLIIRKKLVGLFSKLIKNMFIRLKLINSKLVRIFITNSRNLLSNWKIKTTVLFCGSNIAASGCGDIPSRIAVEYTMNHPDGGWTDFEAIWGVAGVGWWFLTPGGIFLATIGMITMGAGGAFIYRAFRSATTSYLTPATSHLINVINEYLRSRQMNPIRTNLDGVELIDSWNRVYQHFTENPRNLIGEFNGVLIRVRDAIEQIMIQNDMLRHPADLDTLYGNFINNAVPDHINNLILPAVQEILNDVGFLNLHDLRIIATHFDNILFNEPVVNNPLLSDAITFCSQLITAPDIGLITLLFS